MRLLPRPGRPGGGCGPAVTVTRNLNWNRGFRVTVTGTQAQAAQSELAWPGPAAVPGRWLGRDRRLSNLMITDGHESDNARRPGPGGTSRRALL